MPEAAERCGLGRIHPCFGRGVFLTIIETMRPSVLLMFLLFLPVCTLTPYRFRGGQNNGNAVFQERSGYISLFRISESMGGELVFDRILGNIILKRDGKELRFHTGRRDVLFRKNRIYLLKKPPVIDRGEILVPKDALRIVFRELSAPGESWVVRGKSVRDRQRPSQERIKRVVKTGKINIVFIDAGHGGRDPGAVGRGRLREANVVLAIARRVAVRLRRLVPGIRVVLTRKRNRTMSLSARAAIANRYIRKGYRGVFISIHANASLSRSRYGYETYYLSPRASNAESRATAAMENGALAVDMGRKGGSQMDSILSKMLVEEYRRESLMLAGWIQGGLKRKIGRFSRNRGVKKANFFVMRCVFMPSVLVEVGFVTHYRESRLLRSYGHRERIASGIASGVRNFLYAFNRNKGSFNN